MPPFQNTPNLTLNEAENMTDINQGNLTIPATDLNIQPVNLPAQQQQTSSPFDFNIPEQLLNDIQVQDTQAQQGQDQLSQNILSLIPELAGQTEAKIQAENQLGVNTMRKSLQGLNSRILSLNASLQADDVSLAAGLNQIEDKPIAMEFITGEQSSLERRAQIARAFKVAEINTINAQAMAMQGNIALAQDQAKQAVELKYAPVKDALDIYKAQLEAIKPIADRDAQKQIKKQDLRLQFAMRDIEKREDEEKSAKSLALTLAQNQAPSDMISKSFGSKSVDEIMAIPGVQKYLQSPLEKAQLSKLWSDINAMQEIPSPGLTVKQRQELLKDQTARQASARIGVIQAIKDYSDKVELLKGEGTLSPAEKRELESALNTTVGSAINVAQGQGAMGDDEAERILGNLKPKRTRNTNSIVSSARGVMEAQDSLLQSDFGFIDSSYPGATDSFQLFADYKQRNMTDDDFFTSASDTGNISTMQFYSY